MTSLRPSLLRNFWIFTLLAILVSVPALAQNDPDPDPDPDDPNAPWTMSIEVGSRSADPERSRTDTPVPVDVIPTAEIADEAGQLDLGQLLQYAAPSFNSNRQSGSDGSDHVDAATLRGLGPDQVLVLINGKRRHTSSLVYLFGTRARGNVGTDLNTIPVSAIERVEILRDGAAAQYGSDAIAGVINIVLKKDRGLDVLLSAGEYTAGDGAMEQVAVNYGAGIGERGTLSITGEMLNRDRTNRATPDEPRIIGDAQTENNTLFFNLDVPTGNGGAFYGHGGYNDRSGVAGAWYRGGVGSDDIPSRNSEKMYPDGFVPDIGTEIEDLSAAFGYRTLLGGAWMMDISTTYGSNEMKYVISKTLNASIATLNNGISPDEFDAGGFDFTQNTTNLDFSRAFKGWMQGVNVAAGLEHRRETYSIFAGEEGSWRDFDGPGGGNAGSQGFPGFQPADEVDASRSSNAAYVDVEVQATRRFLVTAAVRGEDYDDFGNTINGKVSFGFRATDALNVRGSWSTGFRAPSLHQRYFSSTFTDFIAGEAADVKLAPNESQLARLVGIPPLKEEESVNRSIGFTWAPSRTMDFTLDWYQIDIDDRIVLTGGFTGDDPDIGDIIRSQNLVEARFFTNAIDTETTGLDVTFSHRRINGPASLTTTAALNLNETEVVRVNTAPGLAGKEDIYFNTRERMFVEGSAPKTKGSLGFDYENSRWRSGLRFTYFGELESGTWTQIDDPLAPPQHYDARWTTDLSLGYELRPGLVWTVGGTNIFDEMPTEQDPFETENGALWENVQMGINGAAWYTRLSYKPGRK